MIGLIFFALFMAVLLGALLWWYWTCTKKSKYNGLLWIHPDKGGGMIGIQREPELQKPFLHNYSKWQFGLSMFRRPLYMWAEDDPVDKPDPKDKTKTIKEYPISHWEPTVAADYGLVTKKDKDNEIVIDESKPYITPNELYDTTDWECLRELETAKKPWQETVKLGVAIAMMAICVFGILAAMDMANKNKVAPAPAPAAITQVMDKGDYGLW